VKAWHAPFPHKRSQRIERACSFLTPGCHISQSASAAAVAAAVAAAEAASVNIEEDAIVEELKVSASPGQRE